VKIPNTLDKMPYMDSLLSKLCTLPHKRQRNKFIFLVLLLEMPKVIKKQDQITLSSDVNGRAKLMNERKISYEAVYTLHS
jgi:hypothetical protein